MKVLRAVSLVFVSLLALVLVAAVAVALNGWLLLNARVRGSATPLRVAADSSLFARGEHIARISCGGCHGSAGGPNVSGGRENFFAEVPMPLGRLYAPNLTPGGRMGGWSDAEIARAVREGVDRDGRALLVMPSAALHGLSDRDLAAVVTWLRRQPEVRTHVPSRRLTPLAYMILGVHMFETSRQPALDRPIADPPPGENTARGEYLVGLLDCRTCHGAALRGGRPGQLPPIGPDLVEVASAHDRQRFDMALRQGVSARDGHALRPELMPFAIFSHLDDDEVGAIHAYLRQLGKR